MKKSGILPLMGFVMCAAILPLQAHAQETSSLPYYDVPDVQYKKEYYGWKNFLEYQLNREPCQRYRKPPEGYVMKGCDFGRAEAAKAAEAPAAEPAPAPAPAAAAAPVVAPAPVPPAPTKATIYFGFDSAVIPPAEKAKLEQAASAIEKSGEAHVMVGGHTSTTGPAAYNMKLSEKRADAVAKALAERGVKKDAMTQKGYGETDLAVPTADGVEKPENRRTVIEWDK